MVDLIIEGPNRDAEAIEALTDVDVQALFSVLVIMLGTCTIHTWNTYTLHDDFA